MSREREVAVRGEGGSCERRGREWGGGRDEEGRERVGRRE